VTDVMKGFFTSVVNVEAPAPPPVDGAKSSPTAARSKETVVVARNTTPLASWVAPALGAVIVTVALTSLWNSFSQQPTGPRAAAARTPAPQSAPADSVAADATTPPAAPAAKVAVPPFVFQAKTLVSDGDRQRERDCRVVLASDKMSVQSSEDRKLLRSVPYDSLVSISYSRARHPLWNAPKGPSEVTRADRGALGFLGGARHWVSLRVKNARTQFVVLRLTDEAQAKRVIGALEQRTGRKAEVVVDRSEDTY